MAFRDEEWEDYLRSRVEAVRSGAVSAFELTRADGKVLQYQCIVLPNGGRMLTYFDSTEMKRREQQLSELVDDLGAARDEALEARTQLSEAIEAISEGFVLYDADDKIVLCNSRFQDFYSGVKDILKPGTSFEQFLRAGIERKAFSEEYLSETWLASRLENRRHARGASDTRLLDGRWVHVGEQRTHDGGMVTLYTEITELKRREEQLNELVESLEATRDEALHARTQLLEALEAISEGFVFFDAEDRIVLCNSIYRQFFAEAAGEDVVAMVQPGVPFETFVRAAFERGMFPDATEGIDPWIERRLERRRHPEGVIELRLAACRT